VAPELKRLLELLEDIDDLLDLDRAAVVGLGRVADLAYAGVAGAGVVPAVGALEGQLVRRLVDLDAQAGSRRLSKAPRLADITPLPMRTTSGLSMWGMGSAWKV
jgi:hypothetical protein